MRNRPCHRSDSFQGRAQGGLTAVHNVRQAGVSKARPVRVSPAPAAMPELRFRMRPVPILRLRVTRTSSCILNASEQIASDTGAKIELAVSDQLCAGEPLGFGPILALGFAATVRRWRGRRACNARS